MPDGCICHRSVTGRMCNNQIYFCSQDKQDIRSLGHLNSEKSDTAGGIYTIVPELTSAVREAYVYTR